MQLFVIRHAIAADPSPERPDAARPLTAEGREKFVQAVRGARRLGWRFDRLYHSPLVRAVQTAELIAERLDFLGVIEALPALVPGVPPRVAASELPSRGAAVAVVGHEPGISMLCAYLAGRPSFPPLQKAQVVLIEDGKAAWFIHPETLERRHLLVP